MNDSARLRRIDHAMLAREADVTWDGARRAAGTERAELYVKRALRRRVERNRRSGNITVADALETGSAFRWSTHDDEGSHHVAMGGLGIAAVERAIEGARGGTMTSGVALAGIDEAVPLEREDLDPEFDLPDAELEEVLRARDDVRWLEAGSTAEALVGAGGWRAIRVRHRVWAQVGDAAPRFVSCRGFALDALLAMEGDPPPSSTEGPAKFSPGASSAIVVALATLVHLSEDGLGGPVGPGWVVADEPECEQAVSGGAFDDAGFPTRCRELANGHRVTAIVEGEGTFWRRSYRDAPRSLPSTLVVSPPERRTDPAGEVIARCRVVPVGSGDWILDTERGAMRVHPESLLSGCIWGFGASRLSVEGVVTPGLAFSAAAFR